MSTEKKLDEILSIVKQIQAGISSSGGAVDDESEDFPAVIAYDEVFSSKLNECLTIAKTIDKDYEEITQLIIDCSNAVRALIVAGQKYAKPTGDIFVYLTSAKDAGLAWVKKNFKTKWINQSKALNEMMTFLTWPTIGASSEQFVTEMTGSVMCYTNKIVMENKGKDEKHINWARTLVQAMKALPDYINDHEKGGIKWVGKKPASTENLKPKGFGGKVAAPAAAPAASPVSAVAAKLALPVGKAAAPAPKKEPLVKRVGDSRVEVMYYDGAAPELPQLKQDDIVSFIGCKNTTLEVKAKVKAISVLQSEKVDIVPNDVIGMLELQNVKRAKVYLEGTCKGMSCDKCDSIEIYLNEKSKDLQLISSFSGSINFEYPDPKEAGNYIEFPVPEQITAKFDDKGKLQSNVYVHE